MLEKILCYGAFGVGIFLLVHLSGKILVSKIQNNVQIFFLYPLGLCFTILLFYLSTFSIIFLVFWVMFLLFYFKNKGLWFKKIIKEYHILFWLSAASLFLGTYFCGPGNRWETGIYGDTLSYISWLNSFSLNPLNRADLTILGNTFNLMNMGPVILGAPFSKYHWFSGALFFIVSIPIFGILSLSNILKQSILLSKDSTFIKLFFFFLAFLGIPYTGFIIESPPVLVALPLVFSIACLYNRNYNLSDKFFFCLCFLIILSSYFSKINMVVLLIPALVCRILKLPKWKIFLGLLVSFALLIIFIHFHSLAIYNNCTPNLGILKKAFALENSEDSKRIYLYFLIFFVCLLNCNGLTRIAVLLGGLSFFLFYTACSLNISSLALLTACSQQKAYRNKNIFLVSLLPLFILLVPENKNQPSHVFIVLLLGLIMLVPIKTEEIINHKKNLIFIFLLLTLSFYYKDYCFKLNHGFSNGLSASDVEIWEQVKALTPKKSIIFTDQTGPQITLNEGWNSLAGCGQRQVYIAGYYHDHFLRNNPQELYKKLEINKMILENKLHPKKIGLIDEGQQYYFVIKKDEFFSHDEKILFKNNKFLLLDKNY